MIGFGRGAGVWFVLAGLVFTGVGAGQTQEPDTLQVKARLVVLDVTVTDAKGNFVPGLEESQFSVTEDGKPQKIRSFEAPESHAMPAGTAGKMVVRSSKDLESIGNSPLTIIVLDERNTPFRDVAYTRQMVEKYLKAQPEVLASPTMFCSTSERHQFTVIHDYTQSRAELLEALRKHGNEGDITTLNSTRPMRRNPPPVRLAEVVAPLVQIADSVRDLPGRKNVIWIGYGYPPVQTDGMSAKSQEAVRTVLHDVTDRLLRARVTVSMIDPEGTVAEDISTTDIEDVEARANDPGMLGSSASYGPFNGAVNFETFATASGGHLIRGRNDIETLVEKTTRDGAKYYTLSYTPTSESDQAQGFRKIRVVMKDSTMTARTRDGYFVSPVALDKVTVGEKKQAKQVEFDMTTAAENQLEYSALHVIAGPQTNGVAVRIRVIDLNWDAPPATERKAEVTTMVVFFDKNGKNLGQHAKQMIIALRAEDKVNMSSMVAADMDYAVPPGTQRVRVVVRDGTTGKLGTADLKL